MKQLNYNYIYDASFYGFINCFYTAVKDNEIPLDVLVQADSLLPSKQICSNENTAKNFLNMVRSKFSANVCQQLKILYLSNQANREMLGIKFFEVAVREGYLVNSMLANKSVSCFNQAVNRVELEAKRFIQFIRFSQHNEAMVATIEPQNNILPLLVEHFVSRFALMDFLIFDKTHSVALIYQNSKAQIIALSDFKEPQYDENELKYRKLFRQFYNSVTIKERRNERCRANFMPKKYWKNMTEFLNEAIL